MKIGYARVSTKDQNLERQLDELTAAGCDKIFMEKISGTIENRPEFYRMFEQLREGDVIIITELTRLSRSTKDLMAIVDRCNNLKVGVKSLKEQWLDTTTATGKLLLTIFAGLSQFERDTISERVKSGLTAARARGRVGGRPKIDKKLVEKAIKMYDSKIYTIPEIMEDTGLSKQTIYNYLNERKKRGNNDNR